MRDEGAGEFPRLSAAAVTEDRLSGGPISDVPKARGATFTPSNAIEWSRLDLLPGGLERFATSPALLPENAAGVAYPGSHRRTQRSSRLGFDICRMLAKVKARQMAARSSYTANLLTSDTQCLLVDE